ncbi:MAG: hypothetical protein EOM59_17375, partial [Clostridia bacterium]|nr:hypothetical protein [Clostridia bacterium]
MAKNIQSRIKEGKEVTTLAVGRLGMQVFADKNKIEVDKLVESGMSKGKAEKTVQEAYIESIKQDRFDYQGYVGEDVEQQNAIKQAFKDESITTKDLDRLTKIRKKLGVENVQFYYDKNGANGEYRGGKIRINTAKGDVFLQTGIHEFVHDVEMKDKAAFKAFKEAAMALTELPEYKANADRIRALYTAQASEIGQEGIDNEVAVNLAMDLITDPKKMEAFLKDVGVEKLTLIEKLARFFKGLYAHLKGNPEAKQVGEAYNALVKVLKENKKGESAESGVRKSLIEKYKNLNLNVDISDLDGVPAIELADGSVLPILTEKTTHVQFIKKNNIAADDIKSGGWITKGLYEATEQSDTMRYVEQQKAEQRATERRKSIPLDSNGKELSKGQKPLSDTQKAKMTAKTQAGKEYILADSHGFRGKAKDIVKGNKTKLKTFLVRLFDIPSSTQADFAKVIDDLSIGAMAEDLTKADREAMFKKLFDAGVVTNTEFYDTYKGLKKKIKETRIDSTKVKGDFADWADFRKNNIGILTLTDDTSAMGVDVFHKELKEQYPNLFISEKAEPDLLREIASVAKSIQRSEIAIKDIYDADYKAYLKQTFNDYLDNEFNPDMKSAVNYATEKQKETVKEKVDYTVKTPQELTEIYTKRKATKKAYNKQLKLSPLTEAEIKFFTGLRKGVASIDKVPDDVKNIKDIKKLLALAKPLDELNKAVSDHNKQLKAGRIEQAKTIFDKAKSTFKDKKSGFWYERETAERNIEDVFGINAKETKETYFEPIKKSEADGKRWWDETRKPIQDLKLSKVESELVQLIGEGKLTDDLKGKYTPEQIVKAEKAVPVFRKIYNAIYKKLSDVLVVNGYEPPAYREDYFPHFDDS